MRIGRALAVLFVALSVVAADKPAPAKAPAKPAAKTIEGVAFAPTDSLLFLTPGFVPRDMLTRPMEILASCNPVTYVMEALRSLILVGFEWQPLIRGIGVLAVLLAVMTVLNVRMIRSYD